MKEDNIRSYFQSRLQHVEADEVPSFDDLFQGEALGQVPKANHTWWWTISAVATAAAVAALVVLPARWMREAPMDEPLALVQDPEPVVAPLSETRLADMESLSLPEPRRLAVNPVARPTQTPLYAEVTDDTDEEHRDTETPAMTSGRPQSVETTRGNLPPSYRRQLERAAQTKARRHYSRKGPNLGLDLGEGNALFASVMPDDMRTPLASPGFVTSLRSGSARNEWKEMDLLPKGQIASYAPVYNPPLSLGVSLGIPLYQGLEIQTGITYTYVSGKTTGSKTDGSAFSLYQDIHYLGLPLRLCYRVLDKQWSAYASLGGGLEKGLIATQQAVVESDFRTYQEKSRQAVSGWQPYVGLNLGCGYRLGHQWEIYLEPGIAYYFNVHQLPSSRTHQPFNVNLNGGVRYLFQ